jgi:hypothetical protein
MQLSAVAVLETGAWLQARQIRKRCTHLIHHCLPASQHFEKISNTKK